MSGNTKIAAGAASGGTLAGLGTLAVAGNLGTAGWLYIAAGLSVVGLLIVGYVLAVKLRLKGRAASADRSLLDMMRVRPRSVNDPGLIAKLDRLSEKFESGVETFHKATGQRVSESPWYLLVGESGSGKTEAIRRCGVEFPAGLHEEQQGAGGTTNMDWWFTEEAVILDTAGRYALDAEANQDPDQSAESIEQQEAARAQTEAEWSEFLRLVSKTRPHCPVNGLLLVIPATSLIKDDSDELQTKAKHLAKFLDHIRRTLEVRFPVFVLITKSDLIPGFRDFFEHIKDPALQSQMLGWTKPGSLDEPFDPAEVEKYLKSVRDRLVKRRFALIQDPVHTEVPGARRSDQIDALYTFPDRFAAMAPKLRRYLQMVFVKNKFNQNPLFLRGIYFTSSMEQGGALDETLAKIRGISLKQLEDEERSFRRDRPIFLRDLFMRKVFVENGLVTRESNVRQAKRKRHVMTLASGIAAVLLLGAFLAYSTREFKRSVGSEHDLVKRIISDSDTASTFQKKWSAFEFDDTQTIKLKPVQGDTGRSRLSFLADRVEAVEHDLPVTGLFRLSNTSLNASRKSSAQSMFKAMAVAPIVRRAAVDMSKSTTQPRSWTASDPTTAALATLLAIGNGAPTTQPLDRQSITSLEQFAFSGLMSSNNADFAKLKEMPIALKTIDDIRVPQDILDQSRTQGCKEFIEFWDKSFSLQNENGALFAINRLTNALSEFDQQLDAVNKLAIAPVETWDAYSEQSKHFDEQLVALKEKEKAVGSALDLVDQHPQLAAKDGVLLLSVRTSKAITAMRAEAEPLFQKMIDAANSSKDKQSLEEAKAKIGDVLNKPEIASLIHSMETLGDKLLSPTDEPQQLRYHVAVKILDRAQKQLAHNSNLAEEKTVADNAKDAATARQEIEKLGGENTDKTILADSKTTAVNIINTWALPAANFIVADREINTLPDEVAKLKKLVEDRYKRREDQFQIPALPAFSGKELLKIELSQFDEASAREEILSFTQIDSLVRDQQKNATSFLDRATLEKRLNAKRRVADLYRQEYTEFWSNLFVMHIVPDPLPWPDAHKAIALVRGPSFIRSMTKLLELQRNSLKSSIALGTAEDQADLISRLEDRIKLYKESEISQEIEKIVIHWSNLGENSAQATNAILGITGSKFDRDFFPEDKESYLRKVLISSLASLANTQDRGGAIRQKITAFRNQYGTRFPVSIKDIPLPMATQTLTLEEATDAAAKLKEIIGLDNVPKVDGEAVGSTIAQGSRTQDVVINVHLDQLTGKKLEAAELEQLRNTLSLLELLVSEHDAMSASITPIEPPANAWTDKNRVSASTEFELIGLTVNKKEIPPGNLRLSSVLTSFPMAGTDNEVRVQFFDSFVVDGKQVLPAIRIPTDNWLPLQLISRKGSIPLKGGKIWEVPFRFDVTAPDPNDPKKKVATHYVQWFQLEFIGDKFIPAKFAGKWPNFTN